MLSALGVGATPVVKDGDTNAYVDLPRLGLYLVFTDEGFLEKRPDARIGEEPPLLSNVTFNTSAIPPYATYADALPYGLSFTDGRERLCAALGEPELTIDARKMQRWRKDDLWIFAIYGPDNATLRRLTVQVPTKP